MEFLAAALKYGFVLALAVEAAMVAWALIRMAREGARAPGAEE
jgi:hypothetical protein